jgi:hypothetical protein
MADAVEAMWQDMEQEAADELVRRERDDALPLGSLKAPATGVAYECILAAVLPDLERHAFSLVRRSLVRSRGALLQFHS